MDDYGPIGATPMKPQPMMCIDQELLPEIKDAKIGDKMTLTIEVEVKELRAKRYDTSDRNGMVHAEVCIKSMKKGGE